MAPKVRRRESPSLNGNGRAEKSACLSRKQPWRRDSRLFKESVQESTSTELRRKGQGFAIWRKQKIQRDYRKLLKKERNANSQKNVRYTEDYPEHLKHLYLAEEEMLKKQQKSKFYEPEDDIVISKNNVTQIKFKTKTSNQKAKDDYEKIKAEQDKKKEAAKKRREEREKAQKLYKQKKMETYRMLSKKTRKGQPNLNLQIEYLLQKIEQKS